MSKPVQLEAPERITPRPWTLGADASIYDANGDCIADSFTLWRDDADDRKTAELIVLAVNAFDAQAMRIRELEEALDMSLAVMDAIESYADMLPQDLAIALRERRKSARTALSQKEGCK